MYAGAEQPTDYRSHNGDPTIPPIAAAFTGDGKQLMSNAWTEVPGGVDSIACGASEPHANAHDEEGHRQGIQRPIEVSGAEALNAPRTRTKVPMTSVITLDTLCRMAGAVLKTAKIAS